MKRTLTVFYLVALAIIMVAGVAQAATAVAFSPAVGTLFVGAGVFGAAALLGLVGMALSANASRTYETGYINELPVKASTTIYEGAAVGDDASGYARGLVAGDPFRGFAEAKADNSAGSAGAINVRVLTKGIIKLSITSLAITDVGRPVYASDDGTFALAGIGTFVGYVYRYESSGVGYMEFDATKQEDVVEISIPITLSKLADGDIVTTLTPGFNGRIKGADFIVHDPATTGSKASTLNFEIGTTNLTGGTIALTSANCTPLGKVVAAAAITAGAGFTATDTISVEAASTTSFVEGTGVLRIKLGR
jgi:hypothetical protein